MFYRVVFAVAIVMGLSACRQSESTGPVLLLGQDTAEKTRLLDALRDLRVEMESLRRFSSATGSLQSVIWFEQKGREWTPETADEGRGLRESIERMTTSLRSTADEPAKLEPLLSLIEEDLQDKLEYCRQHGLSSTRQVKVITKREGITEVKGLEVLYLEKFLEFDENARPHQFRGFSSPAVDDLVPGRYLFWARDPASTTRNGPRKDGRIAVGNTMDEIEVLAP